MARQREAARILERLYRRHPDHPGSPTISSTPTTRRRWRARVWRRPTATRPSRRRCRTRSTCRRTSTRGSARGTSRSRPTSARPRRRSGSRRPSMPGRCGTSTPTRSTTWAYAYLQPGASPTPGPWPTVWPGDRDISRRARSPLDYALAAIPARLALERDDWQAAETLSVRPAPAWRGAEGITRFARALGAARGGHAAAARAEIDSLAELERTLAVAGGAQAYWSTQVRIQRLAASAWVATGGGRHGGRAPAGGGRRRPGRRGREASRHPGGGAAGARAVWRPAGPGRPPGRGAGRLHAGAGAATGGARCLAAMGRVGQTVGQR